MILKFILGLGFRPQLNVEKNLIFVDKNINRYENEPSIKNLKQYLAVCKKRLKYFNKSSVFYY
jgi:hypothetical protein